MAFGLLSTDTVKDFKSLNSRRKVFYQYPTGAAPFMGLLSLLPSEETDKPEFGWWERRFPTLRTALVATGTVKFANGDGTALTDGGSGVTLTADTEYRVNVKSTAQFKPTHVIEIRGVTSSSGATSADVKGTCTQVVSATVLKFRPYSTRTAVDNTTTANNDKTVAIIGTANQEYARSGRGVISFPINPTNYTQIFRTAFNLSRTALKEGLQFDKSGAYRNMAWENGLRHMIEMEKAFIFGQKHTVLVTDSDTGDQTPETKTGGVIWFLEQWEAVNSVYRGGTGAVAITLNTDDNKRIIDAGGTMTRVQYREWMGRLFKKTNDKAYEKLCLCGGTHLATVNALLEADTKIVKNVVYTDKTNKGNFEFQVFSVTTLRGTVHYKVHPLFDEDPELTANGLYLDVGNLGYRPLSDSDTVFLKGRQENDRDGRKDEWITEAGLELHFPESCMYIKNAAAAA
jgi:hypothetical protein